MQKILCYDVFLGTVNSVTTDSTLWSNIMYSVLLPVLGYGSELWNLESPNTKHVLHHANMEERLQKRFGFEKVFIVDRGSWTDFH